MLCATNEGNFQVEQLQAILRDCSFILAKRCAGGYASGLGHRAACGQIPRAASRPIFFNNAGASLQPRPVVARVIEHLRLEEQIGGYEAADRVTGELEALYGSVARLLNCAPDEIALQENATRGWEMAFYSLRFAPGDRIVTSANEYASNYIAFLQVAQRTGAEIHVVESDEAGEVDLEALRRLLDDRVKLIALTHLPTNGGLVQPAAQVGALARQAGIPFLLDATQSAGQIHLDVRSAGVRYAVRDRAQIPSGSSRHRVSVCAPLDARADGTSAAGPARSHLDFARQV